MGYLPACAAGGASWLRGYRRKDGRIVVTHTEVPEALSGQGVGSMLVRDVLDRLRADGRRSCPNAGS
jgi:predicted GNAT family acetyltransferase